MRHGATFAPSVWCSYKNLLTVAKGIHFSDPITSVLCENMSGFRNKGKLRTVPAFSTESRQKNTRIMEPPRVDQRRFFLSSKPTSFRMYYDRGDIPIKMEYLTGGQKVSWTVNLDTIDFNLTLPLFFDGLCETKHPYKTYARQGCFDLINHGGEKVYPVIPQLIIPIKNALNTRNIEIMCVTMKIIRMVVMSSDYAGQALVPFYRQILPMFNRFRDENLNCGDSIDYTQKNNQNIGDLIDETLQVLERYGGEDAFINIKYIVPTYESCYLN